MLLNVALLLLGVMTSHAQEGAITADPNAKQLRPIWQVRGTPFVGGERVGEGAGGLGDIYGTGKGAWAVNYGTAQEWRIYRNDSDDIAKDTTPVQVFRDYGPIPSYPVVGDFWGTGHKAVGFARRNVDTSTPSWKLYYELHFYRTEENRIADSESAILNTRLMIPRRQVAEPNGVVVADLDGDSIDELIIVHGGVGLDTGISFHPELWIYKGGPEFQVDSPTVIVRHPVRNGETSVYAAVGDFDGDHHSDIALVRGYGDGRDHLTFYWGTGDLATFGSAENTRILMLTDEHPDADWRITALDCDGDRIMDLAIDRGRGQPARQGIYLFRSGRGRNARTRSYMMDDADQWFAGHTTHRRGGYLNDSAKTYEMLSIIQFGFEITDPSKFYLFSGGPNGPDRAYDAYSNFAFVFGEPLDDVDGDGWPDYLCADYRYGGFDGGLAIIFAGGPYIPHDTSTSSVDIVAGKGHGQAVTVWPNPARDELHIAWRGDLRKMPARFVVHDVLGYEVATGNVDSWRGAALWRCNHVSSGIYMLGIYDIHGMLIATARIIKQ